MVKNFLNNNLIQVEFLDIEFAEFSLANWTLSGPFIDDLVHTRVTEGMMA
jgi:hypothetical protein